MYDASGRISQRTRTIGVPVHIWTVNATAFDCPAAAEILSPAERAKASRYRFEKDRRLYISARASLRRILAERTGAAAGNVVIEETVKPRAVIPPGSPDLFFNISHSGDYAVIALSEVAEVGIDIEQIRPDCPIDELARRYYAPSEYAWLCRLDGRRRLRDFYRFWTLKEAVLKCAGVGLALPPRAVQIRLDQDPPGLRCSNPAYQYLQDLEVRELQLVAGYATALAVATQEELDVRHVY